MNTFYKAITTNDARTENGMLTNSTSSNPLVDLFYSMGASRNSTSKLLSLFSKSLNADYIHTIKAMFYNRDIRGGQGERETFKVMFKYLCDNYYNIANCVIPLIPEYGRWDDLFVAFGTNSEDKAIETITDALSRGDSLCAKWMPREGKKNFDTVGVKIMKSMGLSKKKYRKMLVNASALVVENIMCAKNWYMINYEHVPSIAMHKYSRAFSRNDLDRFRSFLESVKKGTAKINATTLFPHDLVRVALNNQHSSDKDRVEAQWKALKDYVPEGNSFIPVCDVSGSMTGTPMEVSIALGIYLSERNKSVFKDGFITFSGRPTLQYLKGTMFEKVRQLARADWQMNTNLEAVFTLILSKAIESRLSNEDMPKTIIILSDMQFDQAVRTGSVSAMQMIERQYRTHGYQIPNVVFWNLRDSSGVPVKSDKSGTALVSGFSPSIMQNILGSSITPELVVFETLDSERYLPVEKAIS